MIFARNVLGVALRSISNKAFKTDSQRLAFSVFVVGFCVCSGMVRFRGGVAHYLTRRYINGEILEITQFERVDQYVDSFCNYIDDYRKNLNKQGIWLFLATLGIWSVEPDYLKQIAIFITFIIFSSKLFKEWEVEGSHFTFTVASGLVEHKIDSLDNENEREFMRQVFALKKKEKINFFIALRQSYVYVLTFAFFVLCYFEMLVW